MTRKGRLSTRSRLGRVHRQVGRRVGEEALTGQIGGASMFTVRPFLGNRGRRRGHEVEVEVFSVLLLSD